MGPQEDPTSLGNILVLHEVISKGELETALKYKDMNKEMLLGQILVNMGFIGEEKLADICQLQDGLRNMNGKRSEAVMRHSQQAINLIRKANDNLTHLDTLLCDLEAKVAK